jgi:Ca-activated chloride channel family protein
MEAVSNNGNGTYEYIDNSNQGMKVFIEEYKKFYASAKDVKMQIKFNPNTVSEYRLIGYENRLLETEDFDNDAKDAGELGINQTITALYELVPNHSGSITDGLGVIDYRYKLPNVDFSQEYSLEIPNNVYPFRNASENMRFASAVAGFGMLLWESEHSGNLSFDDIQEWAASASSYDPGGWRSEFLELVAKAKTL